MFDKAEVRGLEVVGTVRLPSGMRNLRRWEVLTGVMAALEAM
jgi:hypothetical protein